MFLCLLYVVCGCTTVTSHTHTQSSSSIWATIFSFLISSPSDSNHDLTIQGQQLCCYLICIEATVEPNLGDDLRASVAHFVFFSSLLDSTRAYSDRSLLISPDQTRPEAHHTCQVYEFSLVVCVCVCTVVKDLSTLFPFRSLSLWLTFAKKRDSQFLWFTTIFWRFHDFILTIDCCGSCWCVCAFGRRVCTATKTCKHRFSHFADDRKRFVAHQTRRGRLNEENTVAQPNFNLILSMCVCASEFLILR